MSDRRDKTYVVKLQWQPEYTRWRLRAGSEDKAVEKFKEEWEQSILHNWIKYIAEEQEEEEE